MGALLLGVSAAALAIVAPLVLGIELPVAPLPGQPSIWTFAWYAPAAVAVLGGLAALLIPRLAVLLLILSAAGWSAIAAGGPELATIPLFASAGLAAFGALMAMLAAMFARRKPADGRGKQIEPSAASATELREREVALNLDAHLVARAEDTPTPTHEIPLSLEDVIMPSSEPRGTPPDDIVWSDERPSRTSDDRAMPRRPIFARPVPVERPRPQPEPRAVRGGGLVHSLVMLNAVAIVVLAVAVGYLLLQPHAATVAIAATETPTVATVPAPVLSAAAAPQGASYANPFSYCLSIGTIDRVDARYSGPRITGAIAAALGVPEKASIDRVRWRCVDGEVRACSSFGWPACDVTPTTEEMVEYCRQNPAVDRLMAPNGTWSCKEGKPVLPENASWPVDDRGFLPSAWSVVQRPGSP